ncbi:MAG TPA: hypothetical protein VHB25_14795 [Gemmatimonadaceae bacterium]|nr:hypothetical protein [Gemmatimonadaceae bacterium]
MSRPQAEIGSPTLPDGVVRAHLERAVAGGIISRAQCEAILALPAERAPELEARHGVNAATVAYWAGGIAVLFAFGWFLIARWDVLGASGVLAVSLLYAALFVWAARLFEQHGFPYAATIATLLAVAMVPLITWAALSLVGWWNPYPLPHQGSGGSLTPPRDDLQWLPVELMTIIAALVAITRRRAGVLALPIAVSLGFAGVHVMRLFFESEMQSAMGGRIPLLIAVVLLGVGYAADRAADDGPDYAIWFYAVGLWALTIAMLEFSSESTRIAAHATLALAIVFCVVAIRLRRRIFLVAAFAGFIGYLAYLTFSEFPNALSLPIVLATLGLVTIIATVWVQRRYPGLVRRADAERRRPVPGAPIALVGGLLIAVVMLVANVPAAHARVAEQYQRAAVSRALNRNAAKRDSISGNRRARARISVSRPVP